MYIFNVEKYSRTEREIRQAKQATQHCITRDCQEEIHGFHGSTASSQQITADIPPTRRPARDRTALALRGLRSSGKTPPKTRQQ